MARAVIRPIYPPVDTVAAREDAERGRLLQATVRAGSPRPGLPVVLPLMRLDLARPVRPRPATQRNTQLWLSR